jgi:hypothetical protein
MAQSLRSAVQELNTLIPELEKESSLEILIAKVKTCLQRAIEAHDIYKVNRKRIRTAIEREIDNLNVLLQEVVGLPITPEEKVLAKHNKVKEVPRNDSKNKTRNSLTTIHRESPGAKSPRPVIKPPGNSNSKKSSTGSKRNKRVTGKVLIGKGKITKSRPGKVGKPDVRGRAPGRVRQHGGAKSGTKKSRVPV